MARPIWTGTLSFGLLNVPVSLMSGVSGMASATVSFSGSGADCGLLQAAAASATAAAART